MLAVVVAVMVVGRNTAEVVMNPGRILEMCLRTPTYLAEERGIAVATPYRRRLGGMR